MAEDLQNPTWKYCVIHRTVLLDVQPNRGRESTFWQQREQKINKYISALNIGLAIGTYMVHVCCWGRQIPGGEYLKLLW